MIERILVRECLVEAKRSARNLVQSICWYLFLWHPHYLRAKVKNVDAKNWQYFCMHLMYKLQNLYFYLSMATLYIFTNFCNIQKEFPHICLPHQDIYFVPFKRFWHFIPFLGFIYNIKYIKREALKIIFFSLDAPDVRWCCYFLFIYLLGVPKNVRLHAELLPSCKRMFFGGHPVDLITSNNVYIYI